jgi:hypothetical protein
MADLLKQKPNHILKNGETIFKFHWKNKQPQERELRRRGVKGTIVIRAL